MTKRLIAGAVLLAATIGLLLASRHRRAQTTDPAIEKVEQAAAASARAGLRMEDQPTGRKTGVLLSRDVIAAAAASPSEEPWTYSWATRAREPYYEKLFAKKGHDRVKEEQLLSRLMELFADKPDASIGEVACTVEFCRAELLGTGKVQLLPKYGRLFMSALDPKGLTFVLTDEGSPEAPKASFYFGRDPSWKVPDFAAELGEHI
jgi:hypothetical protein